MPARNPVIQPLSQDVAPVVDPNALQSALADASPAATIPAQQPVEASDPATGQPVDNQDEPLDDTDYEENEAPDQPVTWVAHEYIHQEKGALWFFLFGIVVVALIAVSIFLMHSWSFAALMVVIAVVVIVYSRRPPRELTYVLDDEGLSIDGKSHPFSSFKSFGVIRDGDNYSVMLIPLQRFQPGITVYFPEEAGEDIVDVLGSRLPMKDLKLDAVDRVVRLLRL